MINCPCRVSSAYPMQINRDVSLSMAMNSFPKGGTTLRTAWGRIIWRMACFGVIPRESAASRCPFSIDWIPALKISETYAPLLMLQATTAATKAGIWEVDVKGPSANDVSRKL